MSRVPSWVWGVVGGAASLAIVVAVVLEVGLVNQFVTFHFPIRISAFNCLPSGFPTYRNMSIESASYNFGNQAPDDTASCHMTLDSYDHFADVSSYYRRALNSGLWTTTAVMEQTNNTLELTYHLVERPATHGFVDVLNQAISTQVMVTLFA